LYNYLINSYINDIYNIFEPINELDQRKYIARHLKQLAPHTVKRIKMEKRPELQIIRLRLTAPEFTNRKLSSVKVESIRYGAAKLAATNLNATRRSATEGLQCGCRPRLSTT